MKFKTVIALALIQTTMVGRLPNLHRPKGSWSN